MRFIRDYWVLTLLIVVIGFCAVFLDYKEIPAHKQNTHTSPNGETYECDSKTSCPLPHDKTSRMLEQIDAVHATHGMRDGGKKLRRTIVHFQGGPSQ